MQQEPNAPSLLSELRKRFGDITFGEAVVRRQASVSNARAELDVCDFPVSSGQEEIGTYTVHARAGEVIYKRYQHHGRFLVLRGRPMDKEYRELQHLVDAGNISSALAQMESIGTRNYAIHDFLTLVWSAAHGREDRYANDIAFP